MKTFYGDTYINREELQKIGINYPIKLEYYKTYKDDTVENVVYGIEVVKRSYLEGNTNIEKRIIKNVNDDDSIINKILKILKENEVTPISAQEVIDDLLYAI